jgi:hypothetical protein
VDEDHGVAVVVGRRVEGGVGGGEEGGLLARVADDGEAAFGLGAEPGEELALDLQ